MDSLFLLWFGVLVRLFRGRGRLVLENLALRQQLNVLKRRHPRPRLDLFDKLFWVIAQQFWLWFAKTLADCQINNIAVLPPLFCYNS